MRMLDNRGKNRYKIEDKVVERLSLGEVKDMNAFINKYETLFNLMGIDDKRNFQKIKSGAYASATTSHIFYSYNAQIAQIKTISKEVSILKEKTFIKPDQSQKAFGFSSFMKSSDTHSKNISSYEHISPVKQKKQMENLIGEFLSDYDEVEIVSQKKAYEQTTMIKNYLQNSSHELENIDKIIQSPVQVKQQKQKQQRIEYVKQKIEQNDKNKHQSKSPRIEKVNLTNIANQIKKSRIAETQKPQTSQTKNRNKSINRQDKVTAKKAGIQPNQNIQEENSIMNLQKQGATVRQVNLVNKNKNGMGQQKKNSFIQKKQQILNSQKKYANAKKQRKSFLTSQNKYGKTAEKFPNVLENTSDFKEKSNTKGELKASTNGYQSNYLSKNMIQQSNSKEKPMKIRISSPSRKNQSQTDNLFQRKPIKIQIQIPLIEDEDSFDEIKSYSIENHKQKQLIKQISSDIKSLIDRIVHTDKKQ